MPPNTSPEKCSVIVPVYKYFEAESEERHQSIAGIKYLKEHCQITEICVFSMYYILVYYTVGSITFFEQYRYATVEDDL